MAMVCGCCTSGLFGCTRLCPANAVSLSRRRHSHSRKKKTRTPSTHNTTAATLLLSLAPPPFEPTLGARWCRHSDCGRYLFVYVQVERKIKTTQHTLDKE